MSDKIKIVGQILHTFVFRITSLILGFLRIFIFGKNFIPAQYGAYSLITASVSIGQYLLGLELYNYILRNVPGKEKKERLVIFKSIVSFEFVFPVLIVLLVILLNIDGFLCQKLNIPEYKYSFRFGLFIIVLMIIQMEFIRYFIAVKRIKFSNIIDISGTLTWILLLVVLWIIGVKITVPVALICWAIGISVTIFIGLFNIGVIDLIKSKINPNHLTRAFEFGIPLILVTIGYYIIEFSDRYILSYYKTTRDVGLYAYSYNIIKLIYTVFGSVVIRVFVPYLVEAHNKNNIADEKFYINGMLKYPLLVVLPIIIGILIVKQSLILTIAKPEYLLSAGIFPYLILIPIITIATYPAHYTNYLANRTKTIGINYVIGAAVNIGLNFLLIPKYSYYGAAVATVISLLLIMALMYWTARDKLLWNFSSLKVEKILVLGILVYFIARYLNSLTIFHFQVRLWNIVIICSLILLLYVIGLFFLGIITEKEKRFIKKLVSPMFNRSATNSEE